MTLLINALLLCATWYVLLPAPAHAYFDLSTGTYMAQLILSFGVAFWLSFKKDWLGKFMKKKEPGSESPAPEAAGASSSDTSTD